MPTINVITNAVPAAVNSLISDLGDGKAFEDALNKASARKKEIVSSVLKKRRLSTSSSSDNEYSLKKGYQNPVEVRKSLDLAKAGLPASYRKQVGTGLVAMGRDGSSVNSMAAGAGLMDCSTSGQALKGIFSSLGAERSFLKLDKEALPALGQILADSGLDEESINNFLNDLVKNGLTVDQLFCGLSKINLETGPGGGLKATEDGLMSLGQFFGSLGASSEIVDMITGGFQSGEDVTAAALRGILSVGDDGNLASNLSEADAYNLAGLLRSMGAGRKNLNSLSNLLAESRGHLSINDFLNFIESMENAPAKSVGARQLEQIQAVLNNISRDQQLVKTPVFDEILTKIQLLGDREIDGNFVKLSPALQALRGGLSGMAQQNAFGGQNGQNGQGAHKDGREDKEQYRQVMNAALGGNGASQAAAVEATETAQGYGGQESLARQIGRKMIYSHRRGVKRLKMKLNPENMGRLDIELRVKGDQLTAHIRAESREAYQALASGIESLKEALAEGGLTISSLTVAFDDGQGGEMEFADLGDAFPGPALNNDRNPPDGSAAAAYHRVV